MGGAPTNWGEPERAPPRALQRLRSLSHNGGGGISYVLPNAHARSLRGQHSQVQRSVEAGQRRGQAESHTGETRDVSLRF